MFKKIDHQVDAKDKLLYQFKDLTNVNILLKIITKQLNDMEDTLADMKEKRGVKDAIGKQLDVIGLYKNVNRQALPDLEYRKLIFNKIALDSSNGTCEAALLAAKTILGGGKFLYSESYPACCEMFIRGSLCDINQYKFIKNSVSLSVSLSMRFCKTDRPFGFNKNKCSGYGSIYNTNKGGGYASIIGDEG